MKKIAIAVIAVFIIVLATSVVTAQETADVFWMGGIGYLNFENGELSVLQKLPKAGFGGPYFGKITHDTIITIYVEGKNKPLECSKDVEARNLILDIFNKKEVIIIGQVSETGEGEGFKRFARELMILKLK